VDSRKNQLGREPFATGKNVIPVMKIGDFWNMQDANNGGILTPMKTINRMALGTISSLLLSAGLAKAAQKLDPVSNSIVNCDFGSTSNEASSSNCTYPCFFLAD
jgi:hypothetical protein